jgi:putrescine aminotransferase
MAAIQLSRNPQAREAFPAELEIGMVCRKHCFDIGLVMRAVGDRMIVAPPLIITREQIDEMLLLVWKALDLTYADALAGGLIGTAPDQASA